LPHHPGQLLVASCRVWLQSGREPAPAVDDGPHHKPDL